MRSAKLMQALGLFVIWMGVLPLAGQQTSSTPGPQAGAIDEAPYVNLQRTTSPMTIDGKLDEEGWLTAAPATNFWQNFPSDDERAPYQTEIHMLYNDGYLYLGAKCYAPGRDYIISSLRRDFRAGGNDNITFVIDPFRDKTNAFVFGMNPLGVMREALIANGGRDNGDFREEWDNKWWGESYIGDDYWSCELAIPFSTLRFPDGQKEWYFNAYRFDMQSNTRSSWNHIPRNQIIMSLAYMGRMVWPEAPQRQGGGFTIIPYVTGGLQRNYEAATPTDWNGNVGADAKINVSTGLNLDLTVNPDFSQVEVDRQVINLSRFEIFFPERRQFFLENVDLFGGFGNSRANPFFSRRIGVTVDTSTGEALQNPIYLGARLSGKLNNDWRLGLLNMQAAPNQDNGLPSFNYTVAALQRKLFTRSNVGLIFVNKQTFEDSFSDTTQLTYNRVLGLDYNLASADNRWNGKTFYHRSFSPEQGKNPFAHGIQLEYRVRDYAVEYNHDWIGEGYNARVGFVPRSNFFSLSPQFSWFFYSEDGALNQHGPVGRYQALWTPGNGRTDERMDLGWDFNFRNTADLNLRITQEYTYLLEDFDPTRSDAVPLPGEQGYRYTAFRAFYQSDRRRRFNYRLEPTIGQFFNGNQYSMEAGLTYRYQPFGDITLNVNYSYVDLPPPYATTAILLIGPRVDLTFSRSIFLTTFLQYNDQIENINLNARLQWRFAPVSDFFLVYTDNYYSTDFTTRNRAVVAKLTYWLNM